MSNVQAMNAPVGMGYSSEVSGEFSDNNEYILTSTQRGQKSTKTYSVSKAENNVVVEKHIKFFGKTIGKIRISPRSILFSNEAKKVYTAIAKNYLKPELKDLNADGIDGPNEAQVCNIKRLMTKFPTQDSVVALVADLSPKEGAKLLAWCVNNSNNLPEPLSTKVKENPSRFVASCVECAVKDGYGSKHSPYNPEANSDASGKFSELMTWITYHDDNLAIGVVNYLENTQHENQNMMECVKALASNTFSEIGRTCQYTQGHTIFMSKLANINSKEVRNSIRETPIVFLKLLPELHEASINKNHFKGLPEKVQNSYGESLTQYSNALLEDNLKTSNHYLTLAFSTNNNEFNCENMLKFYDSIAALDSSQQRNCHNALLKHTNIPSTLKYLSAMDGRRIDFESSTRKSEICSDFKIFVGANESGQTFSVDRVRLQAFVNSPDISQEQKTRCYEELPLAVVYEIAKNQCGDYSAEGKEIANQVAGFRFHSEQRKNPKFSIPEIQLQLRDSRIATTLPQQHAGAQNLLSPHITFEARQQLDAAATGINQFVGELLSPFHRRETVNHQHREGFYE